MRPEQTSPVAFALPDHPCLTQSQDGAPAPLSRDLPDDLRADRVFDAYMAADAHVLTETLRTNARFEQFRKDFRDRVLPAWKIQPWQPARAVFMLDVAVVAFNGSFRFWLDFIEQGRRYVIGRVPAPGVDAAADAFEITWHQASVAVLSGLRRPDYVAECGIDPLDHRMAAEPSATGGQLIDPWIELARGYRDEGFTIVSPVALATRGPSAIAHYVAATKYDATRAEGAVREAWMLIRLDRAAEALVALDGVDERRTVEKSVIYWSRLFRGRALARLGRLDDAARAYESALTVAPQAQSPKVGLVTVELERDRNEAAYKWAADTRTAPETSDDPFWLYPFGDRRFLAARLTALRVGVRR
jgi:hypothetical protein